MSMAAPPTPPRVRSDNDWLIYNLEASQAGMASIIEQAEMGRFSRLVIKHATLDMNDALYGMFRTFNDISLDIAPTPNGKAVEGSFSAAYARRRHAGHPRARHRRKGRCAA